MQILNQLEVVDCPNAWMMKSAQQKQFAVCWLSKRVDAEVRSADAYQPDAVDDCLSRVQMKKSVSAGVHQNQLDSGKLFQNSFDVDCPSQLVLLIVVKLRQLLIWIAVSALNTVSQVYHLKLGF